MTILLVFILFMISKNWESLKQRSHLSFTSFLTISLFHFLFLLSNAKRFHLVIHNVGKIKIGFFNWLRIFIEGRLLNKIFPQLGNVYRGHQLHTSAGLKYGSYAGSYLFFTWFDTLINFSIATFLVFFHNGNADLGALLPLLLFMSTLILILPKIASISSKITGKISIASLSKMSAVSSRLFESISEAISMKIINKLLLYGLFSFLFMAVRLYIGFLIFDVHINVFDLVFLYAFYKLSIMVVLTPGNLGIQEISIGALSGILGYDMNTGMAVAILLRLYGYVLFFLLWCMLSVKSVYPKKSSLKMD